MEISEIKELIRLIEESDIEEFEMERSGVRIRVRKTLGGNAVTLPAIPQSAGSAPAAPIIEEATQEEDPSIQIFKSPVVGTYYSSPKPDLDPFVRVGSKVAQGDVLCIIEAMKIFNQIESDVDGEVIKILVANGQAVEYGEPLFEIRTA